jgi:hypothetical protein
VQASIAANGRFSRKVKEIGRALARPARYDPQDTCAMSPHRGTTGGLQLMAVDGTWNLTMQTPMGERTSSVTLSSSGGTLTGTQTAEGNSAPITDGTVNGDSAHWSVAITNPMPLTLTFDGQVSGNDMTGDMMITGFGTWPFTGKRE